MKKLLVVILIVLSIISAAFLLNPFNAPSGDKTVREFNVENGATDADVVTLNLSNQGFIKSSTIFGIALNLENKNDQIKPGGYFISKNMNAFSLAKKLSGKPDFVWLTIIPGFRKEQVGERLEQALSWSDSQLKDWNDVVTASNPDYFEGVYLPDTYLIPSNADPSEAQKVILNNFNEKFAPYLSGFNQKDILWTTGLKIASIIQRESAGTTDMKLISGIIWNRLLAKQKLEIDATVQYAKGKTDGNWWPPVFPKDITNIDSPYNTYEHVGLPPSPISEPSLAAIDAALNPQTTDCLYYLHDSNRQIHCSATYQEHLQNIEKYLDQ